MSGAPSSRVTVTFFFSAEEALVSARAGSIRHIFGGEGTVSWLVRLAMQLFEVDLMRDTTVVWTRDSPRASFTMLTSRA